MKLNWKTVKVLFAFAIIIGAIFWAVNTSRPHSYSGTNLSFEVGSGSVSVMNPSEQSLPVQLVSTGSRSFRVSGTSDAVSGSSTRQGSGSSSSQLFEFELPSGISEFTVTRGTDVNFLANTTTILQVTVNPVSDGTFKAAVITTIVVVLGSLYYASNATNHYWLSWFRSQFASIIVEPSGDTEPTPAIRDGGQGTVPRSYGDSRASAAYGSNPANTGD